MAKKIRYLDRNKEPFLSPLERVKSFKEFALGFSVNLAIDEANRCLFCKDADQRCIKGCPINVDIPGFIKKITEGDLIGAYKIIIETDIFPSICGRICPQERQCEGSCILEYDTIRQKKNKGYAVNIGALEKFVGDFVRISGIKNIDTRENTLEGFRVAVIGAGPAGLAVAYDLARWGAYVDVFEAFDRIGGVMYYGIPKARLNRDLLKYEQARLEGLGVRFHFGVSVGRTILLSDIIKSYDSVFIGIGAGKGNLGLKGDDLNGVYSAIEFLMRVNLLDIENPLNRFVKEGERVVIIGGGFTAVDCALSSLRLSLDTTVVYRRTRETSSARQEEWDHLLEEGAKIMWLTLPKEIIPDENGNVKALRCVKMELGEPDSSGRPSPREIPNSDFIIECDKVIFAIGQKPNPIAFDGLDIKLTKWGTVEVDENYMSSIKGVFAAGDIVNGGDTVVRALSEGRKAAISIKNYLLSKGGLR